MSEGRCMKCRKTVKIVDPKLMTAKNGKPMKCGKCGTCGTKVCTFKVTDGPSKPKSKKGGARKSRASKKSRASRKSKK